LKVFKLIIFVLFINNSYALPGAIDHMINYSDNEEFFNSKVVNCQKVNSKNVVGLEGLANFLSSMNCNKLIDPAKFCNCISRVSINGLTLSEEEEEVAKASFEKVAYHSTIENMELDIELIPGINEFLATIGDHFDRCFQGEGKPFSEVGKIEKKPISERTLLEKSKLSMFRYLHGKFEKSSKDMEDESFDLVPSFKEYYSNYIEGESSNSSDSPYMSLFIEHNNDPKILNDYIASSKMKGFGGRSIIKSNWENLVIKKCGQINEIIESKLNSELESTVNVTESIISGKNPELKIDNHIFSRIKSENYTEGIQSDLEMFNIDKLYCKNLKNSQNGRSKKEEELINNSVNGPKYQKELKESKKIEEEVFDLIAGLKELNVEKETISSKLETHKEMLKGIEYLASLENIEDVDRNHPDLSGLDPSGSYDLEEYKLYVSIVEMKREDVARYTKDLEKLNNKIEPLAKKLNEKNITLSGHYSNLSKIKESLVVEVGAKKANKMIGIIKSKIAFQIHSEDIKQSIKTYRERERVSIDRNTKFQEKVISRRAKRRIAPIKSKSQNVSKSIVPFKPSKVEATRHSQNIEKPVVKTKSIKSYMNNSSFVDKSISEKNIKNNKKERVSKREQELQRQIEELNKIIDSKNTKKIVEGESEVDRLRRELEMQKILNEKTSIQNELNQIKKETYAINSTKSADVDQNSGEFRKNNVVESRPFRSLASVPRSSNNSSIQSNNVNSSLSKAVNSNLPPSVSSTGNELKSSSKGGGNNSLIPSGSDMFTLSSETNSSGVEGSRVVKLDFALDSIPDDSKNAFFESLFLQGEQLIVLELPDGEKIVLENKNVDKVTAKEEKLKSTKLVDEAKSLNKRTTVKYKDLKDLIDSNLDVE
jgi:hypothetical protein